jgi:quercetin dioxygenase-like cupin family protein
LEIRRFGPGHRRPDGPPGTQGVGGQVILNDERASVSELAFGRYAMVSPHINNDSSSLFVVISGAGFVQVGDERARVNHGEAVLWPAGVMHGAYTDGTEMRAIVVELHGRADVLEAAVSARVVSEPEEGEADSQPRPARAEGALAGRQLKRDEYDSTEGEPW